MPKQEREPRVGDQLGEQLQAWQAQTTELKDRLETATQDGDSDEIKSIQGDLTKLEKERIQFLQEPYLEAVKEELTDWYPDNLPNEDNTPLEDFLANISVDPQDARLIYQGDLDLINTQITEFPKLIKEITGTADFIGTQLEHLDQLERVGGYLYLYEVSQFQSAERLKVVGGDADFRGTQLERLDQLERVGGDLWLDYVSQFQSAERLKEVGGNADFEGTQLEHLDQLERVGGDLYLASVSQFQSAERLEEVGGNASFEGTELENFREALPNLTEIGEYNGTSVWLSPSQAELKEQIEAEVEAGNLRLAGEIKVAR